MPAKGHESSFTKQHSWKYYKITNFDIYPFKWSLPSAICYYSMLADRDSEQPQWTYCNNAAFWEIEQSFVDEVVLTETPQSSVHNVWCKSGWIGFYGNKPLTSLLQKGLLWISWLQKQELCVPSVSHKAWSVTKPTKTAAAYCNLNTPKYYKPPGFCQCVQAICCTLIISVNHYNSFILMYLNITSQSVWWERKKEYLLRTHAAIVPILALLLETALLTRRGFGSQAVDSDD